MEKKSFGYGDYKVYVYGRQLTNEDGSSAKWMAHAEIIRTNGNEDMLVPLDGSSSVFDTEQEAQTYAAVAAKKLIDSGHCKI